MAEESVRDSDGANISGSEIARCKMGSYERK